MQYTSSEANKLLKKLNSDLETLLSFERDSSTFLAATGEDPESVRPAYDYKKTCADIDEVSRRIRVIKHAVNVFNATTKVEGFDMTIDEMLVMLPQLSARVRVLDRMRSTLPKLRERTFGSGTNATIDYRYTNYDTEEAARDYERFYALLSKAQSALDLVNNTVTMEIEL